MNQIIMFCKERKKLTASVFLTLTLQSIGTLLIPFMTAALINMVADSKNGTANVNMNAIVQSGVHMALILLITTIFYIWASYLSAEFSASVGKMLRDALFKKSQELSVSDFENFGTSSMLTRTTTDITIIQRTTMFILQLVVPMPLILITAIVLTFKENITLGFVTVGFMVILIVAATTILKKSLPLSRSIQARMDKINRKLRESIVGVRVIRAFNQLQYEKENNNSVCSDYANTMITLNKLFAFLNPITLLSIGFVIAAVLWVGGGAVIGGSMKIGSIVAVTEYSIISLTYVTLAANSIVTLPKMLNCLDRVNEVLSTTTAIQDSASQSEQTKTDSLHSVVFDKVGFSYEGAEEKVLNEISFSCQAGKTTAIIGSTGSGKSTIAKILLRLHDIQSGRIILDGKSIQDYSQNDLREKISYVPQKAFLFSGSISDNLKMGKKDASISEQERAIRIAQAEPFVNALPERLNASVSQGGTNFSGGQKQRLAIARALIKNADIYIFDDSFSALDFKTDAALRKSLKENITDSIVIIIAQRINTIIDADQIIVLDQGNIVGIGKHDELLKSCNVYREIAKSQLDMEV